MDFVIVIVKSPFVWGLAIGFGFFVYTLFRLGVSSRELSRYKRMLSDKMEVEAELTQRLKSERQKLEKENKNLRVEVSILSEKPDAKIENEREILLRAEKSMVMNAPGFPAAWETAKQTRPTKSRMSSRVRVCLSESLKSFLVGVLQTVDRNRSNRRSRVNHR